MLGFEAQSLEQASDSQPCREAFLGNSCDPLRSGGGGVSSEMLPSQQRRGLPHWHRHPPNPLFEDGSRHAEGRAWS